MNNKKILIMIMSCNEELYQNQQDIIKNTWLKKIEEYDNIDYIIYYGDENIEKHSYNKESHILKLRCEDDLKNTFKKTYYALNLSNKIYKDYDYIFRTNTSNYVNVELLDKFISCLDDENILWTSELYSLSNTYCPYPLYLYGRGNGLILSKKLVNIILKEGKSFLYYSRIDDHVIGNILNSYWIKEGKNYIDYIKSFTHGWYKCLNIENTNNHLLCIWGNKNKDWNFINKFITIQVRKYDDSRTNEEISYNELLEVFLNNKYENIDEQIKFIMEYSKNPSVFIGSTLGYINYNIWINTEKIKLFELENNNKAPDDKNDLLNKWL